MTWVVVGCLLGVSKERGDDEVWWRRKERWKASRRNGWWGLQHVPSVQMSVSLLTTTWCRAVGRVALLSVSRISNDDHEYDAQSNRCDLRSDASGLSRWHSSQVDVSRSISQDKMTTDMALGLA
ncbi:hypothetical protein BHE74_00059058 [Ensete ventricosum]|nr:hypothetical protein BHE74_00059058 [Ensete ventricosum]